MSDCLEIYKNVELARLKPVRIWDAFHKFCNPDFLQASSAGEPEVLPRDELVQNAGREDQTPRLPGEHAGRQYKGE